MYNALKISQGAYQHMLSTRSVLTTFLLFLLSHSANAQSGGRTVFELFNEVDRYEAEQRKAYANNGKRFDSAAKEDVLSDRRALAKRYAVEIEGRTDINGKD